MLSHTLQGSTGEDCGGCGLPLVLGRGNVWLKGGIICGRAYPHQKGTFYDVDDLNHLFRSVAEEIGLDIDRIITAARYVDTRVWMTHWSRSLLSDLGGFTPAKLDMYGFLLSFISNLGFARGEIVEYEEGRRALLRVENPYSVPLLLGDIKAVVEFIEDRPISIQYEGDDRILMITIERAAGAGDELPEIPEPPLVEEAREEDYLDCERCLVCGAPVELSRLLSWERERALIKERLTGQRYCFHDTSSLAAVIRRIISELGDDFGYRVVEIERDYARDLFVRLDDDGPCRAALDDFPVLGWGEISGFEETEGRTRFMVANPFSEHVLAGRLWGTMEALYREHLGLDWNVDERGQIEMVLTPGN